MNKCSSKMPCGHICPKICHAGDRDHVLFECQENCIRFCSVGHPCPKKCFKDCNPCMERVTKMLPCTHEQMVLCHQDPTKVFCQTSVWKVFQISDCIPNFLFKKNKKKQKKKNRSFLIAAMAWIRYAEYLFLTLCVLKCVA
jgi:hypothetical protein